MITLAPMPQIGSASFIGGAPGGIVQPWSQYLLSLDVLIRAHAIGGAGLIPLPQPSFAVVVPASGAPTQPWQLYWNARDVILRASGWKVNGQLARQALKPLPPTIGFSMVFGISGALTIPWAQYFASCDALARPQAH